MITCSRLTGKQLSEIAKDNNETIEQVKQRFETPLQQVYNKLLVMSKRLGIPSPELDVFASSANTKCFDYIDKEMNAYVTEFILPNGRIPKTIYSNAMHKEQEQAVRRIYQQYQKYDFNVLQIIPAINSRSQYFGELIEPNRVECSDDGFIFYTPFPKVIYFEIDQEPVYTKSKKPPYTLSKVHDQSGYLIVFWSSKTNLKDFKLNVRKFYQNVK